MRVMAMIDDAPSFVRGGTKPVTRDAEDVRGDGEALFSRTKATRFIRLKFAPFWHTHKYYELVTCPITRRDQVRSEYFPTVALSL